VTLTNHALDPIDQLDRLDPAAQEGKTSARSSPSCTAYSPATRVISAATRESRSSSASWRALKTGTLPISSAVTTIYAPLAETTGVIDARAPLALVM